MTRTTRQLVSMGFTKNPVSACGPNNVFDKALPGRTVRVWVNKKDGTGEVGHLLGGSIERTAHSDFETQAGMLEAIEFESTRTVPLFEAERMVRHNF